MDTNNSLKKVNKKRMSLQEATKYAPNDMGCYKMFYHGKLIYVGKAENGLRKRMVQYYNGTTVDYQSGLVINQLKDNLSIEFQTFNSKKAVQTCEAKWISDNCPILNSQSGWGDKNVLNNNTSLKYANTMSPERLVSDYIADTVKDSTKQAVAMRFAMETMKAIEECEEVEGCAGRVASGCLQTATASAVGSAAGTIASFVAIALGAGPIGMAIVEIGVGTAVGAKVADAVTDVAADVGFKVQDTTERIRLESSAVDLGCTLAENCVLNPIGSLIDDIKLGIWPW